jgi:hypothetical protein
MFFHEHHKPMAIAAVALILAGAAVGIIALTSGGSSSAATTSATAAAHATGARAFGRGGGGSNARSGPAAGGSIGTVSSLSRSGFTLSTSTGETVTKGDIVHQIREGNNRGVQERCHQSHDRPRARN